MKRFKLPLLVCCLIAIFQLDSVQAKNDFNAFTSVYDNTDYKRHRFAIDFGIGGGKGGGAFDLGLRYQYNFAPFLGWDALSVKVGFPTKDPFDENPQLQFMTGLRGTSPCFYKDMSGFFALSAGYGLSTDTGAYSNDGGVCFELGTGINLCKNIYAGYAFNLQKINIGNVSSKGKVHYFRVGFVF